jgi:hypothetical protein
MIAWYAIGYVWPYDQELLLKKLTDFRQACEDFAPLCFKWKEWVFIKEDVEDTVKYLSWQQKFGALPVSTDHSLPASAYGYMYLFFMIIKFTGNIIYCIFIEIINEILRTYAFMRNYFNFKSL